MYILLSKMMDSRSLTYFKCLFLLGIFVIWLAQETEGTRKTKTLKQVSNKRWRGAGQISQRASWFHQILTFGFHRHSNCKAFSLVLVKSSNFPRNISTTS
ncbi:hypothetical protein BC829DRAFT_66962 [Chytridium lagenaria]|nr:hypothetical protein BC829DRAFT_66962 [Chytridium lagenaria]